jgi:hypothetical protein
MHHERIARRVASRFLYGYDPSTEWEKMVGEVLTQQGVTDDASKDVFDKALSNAADEMEMDTDELKDMDPEEMESSQYDDFVRGVMEAADEAGLIED